MQLTGQWAFAALLICSREHSAIRGRASSQPSSKTGNLKLQSQAVELGIVNANLRLGLVRTMLGRQQGTEQRRLMCKPAQRDRVVLSQSIAESNRPKSKLQILLFVSKGLRLCYTSCIQCLSKAELHILLVAIPWDFPALRVGCNLTKGVDTSRWRQTLATRASRQICSSTTKLLSSSSQPTALAKPSASARLGRCEDAHGRRARTALRASRRAWRCR